VVRLCGVLVAAASWAVYDRLRREASLAATPAGARAWQAMPRMHLLCQSHRNEGRLPPFGERGLIALASVGTRRDPAFAYWAVR